MAQVQDVFEDEPVEGEDGDLFSRLPIDLLTLEAKVEPGTGDKVYGLTNIDPGGETSMVGTWEG